MTLTVAQLESLLEDSSVQAGLRVIRAGESSQDESAYTIINGGSHFSSFDDHPTPNLSTYKGGKAAGAYQFLPSTWAGLKAQYGFTGFTPHEQDLGAVALICEKQAIDALQAGDWQEFLDRCRSTWVSLPRTLTGKFATAAGIVPTVVTPTATATKERSMPAILAALIPALLAKLDISKITDLFKPGVPVTERNTQIGIQLFDLAKSTFGVPNEQAVIEHLDANPEAVVELKAKVFENWYAIMEEGGGGGIAGARQADTSTMMLAITNNKWWIVFTSPSFLMALCLLPLVYLVVLSIIGMIGNVNWSNDVRAAIAGTVVGSILGGLIGYYYGQVTSKNRSPSA
jgi:muramidase (phage lysozyme)